MKKHLLLALSLMMVFFTSPRHVEVSGIQHRATRWRGGGRRELTAKSKSVVSARRRGDASADMVKRRHICCPWYFRSPLEYQVIEVVDSIGKYGGTMNAVDWR